MLTALKDAAKSALLVWFFTTIGLFIPGMLGWIQEVSSWAEQKGAPAFPDPSNLAYLFVAALTAAFPGAVAGLLRFIENFSGKQFLPRTSSAPVNDRPKVFNQHGVLDTRTAAILALVLVVVVILILVL